MGKKTVFIGEMVPLLQECYNQEAPSILTSEKLVTQKDGAVRWMPHVLKEVSGAVTRRYMTEADLLCRIDSDGSPLETEEQHRARVCSLKDGECKWFPRRENCLDDVYWAGVKKLPDQIYEWVKRQSANRGKKSQYLMPSIPTARVRKVTAYDMYRKSNHPSKPSSAPSIETSSGSVRPDVAAWSSMLAKSWEGLCDNEREHFKKLAEESNKSDDANSLEVKREVERAAKAAGFFEFVEQTLEMWRRETGWVATIILGGINEDGVLVNQICDTGEDSHGNNFQDRLLGELKWSEDRLLCSHYAWLLDIFKRKLLPMLQ
ncbi:hypothetical protein PHLCEN_2v12440 [Hermanssonia centrifuga]|uniref:HMG box domain-containing protein n=1 Tax=Hermanssonia centrifuga TaxID=98765 RepID=A0A2R6NH19_9APHY|nr:hypothetical protein PHLCEN_2v12440 [Hermanssonia centrifuga]